MSGNRALSNPRWVLGGISWLNPMRHEIKFSAVEQDADAVVGEVAESTGAGFGGLDAAVEAFGGRVADPVTEPCQDAG